MICMSFQMPVDISTLSEEDRKARLRKRDPKKAVVKKEKYFEDDFKIDDYSQFWKKKWSACLSVLVSPCIHKIWYCNYCQVIINKHFSELHKQ